MIKEAIHKFYNKKKEGTREVGKYWASELNYMSKGYATVPMFIRAMEGESKPIDKNGQANIFRGSAMEDMLCKILTEEKLEFKTQTRLEIEIEKGIFISGKLDFDFPDFILETKCPAESTNGVPDKWKMQMEFYYRATKKNVFLGIFDKNGDEIIRFFPYEPSDKVWSDIRETVINFNERLIKKLKKK